MEIKNWNGSQGDLMRIIQESVPGKQITMAHIIASPDEVIYKKLGLDPKVDYHRSAIGVLTLTPSETAIITDWFYRPVQRYAHYHGNHF